MGIVIRFLAVMTIIVTVFAVIGYYTFDTQAEEFSTMKNCIWSILKVAIKQFDLQSLKSDQTSTLFILLFAVVMHYILLSVLTVIVLHVYFFFVDVGDFLSERMGLVNWTLWRQNDQIKHELLEDLDDFQDVYTFLKRLRFTDIEAKIAIKKIGVKQKKTINENADKNKGTTSKEDDAKKTEVKQLVNTISSLQKNADKVNRKIDVIIKRLDSVHWRVNNNSKQ